MSECEKCGLDVSEKVEAYSKDKFDGKIYCFECQKKVRGDTDGDTGWEYKPPKKEDADAKNKGTLDGYSGGEVPNSDSEEIDDIDAIAAENEEELNVELNDEFTALRDKMSAGYVEQLYEWFKSEYDAGTFDELNIEKKRTVLEQTRQLLQQREAEKVAVSKGEEVGEIVIDAVYVSKKKANMLKKSKVKEESVETLPERKFLKIDWDNIPKQIFVPKLVKALEYIAELDAETVCFDVKKASGESVSHITTEDSCNCGDFVYRGTSLNPCVHQIRIKYPDEEIRAKLKGFGVSDIQSFVKAKRETKVVPSEQDVAPDMMIQGLIPRLAEVGKIKIGSLSDKIVSGRRLPKKLDHFVVTSLLRDENGDLMLDEELSKKIGSDCHELDIYLCYDSLELNMPTFYAYFTQSKLRCMGNGKKASRTVEEGGKEEVVCNPKTCDAFNQKQCKPYGRLSVILADANRIGGSYILRTTSWNTLRNILSSMSFIKNVTGGILAGIPLSMRLLPMSVMPKDVGHNVKIYVVNIEFSGTIRELQDVAKAEVDRRLSLGMNMRQIESENRKLLVDQVREEAEEEASEIAEEFAPEEEG